ncbi:REP-associated tyrosine transposase [Aeromonas salmonicida]|uniref:REP-associated tyrosine transposase n=1 Tax=Aeromonas salmonicida TaxID=645 RepID=UPI003D006B99
MRYCRATQGRFLTKTLQTELIQESRLKKRERGIWQRRYWEHLIRDDKDLQAHVDYIHFNPVKHGYCAKIEIIAKLHYQPTS